MAQQSTGSDAPGCTVRASGGDGGPVYELSNEQAANAATISAVGTTRGLPERAVTIALATALQESALRNIRHGDRDSLGLFQQRPSKGWGTPEQIMDPVYSAGKFYDGLVEVPGYSRLPLTVAAQKVQRSGFPQAYAKHEPDAALLSAALTGRAGAALRCVPGGDGKAGDPARVRSELVRAFGPAVLPKGAGGADTGTGAARGRSTDGDGGGDGGMVVTVPVRGPAPGAADRSGGASGGGRTPGAGAAGTGAADERSDDRGWEVAHWAVARAERLRIAEVSYGGRVWRSGEAEGGWREAGAGGSGARTAETVRIRLAR